MKGKILTLFFLATAIIFTGCVKDDLEELQSQIDDLNEKVDDLEQAQQEALLQAITDLQAALANLESSNDAQYATLIENLNTLEAEVANNAASVYYGNLLTDADYAAYTDQGATIVTGKVIVTTSAQGDALASLRMVGGSMSITASASLDLPALESVGDELLITETTGDAVVSMPMLSSVGASFDIINNTTLAEVVADALVLVNGDLYVTMNPLMSKLSMASLDLVHEIYINEYWANDPEFVGFPNLSAIDLSATDVLGDVRVEFVSGGTLSLGEIDGSFYVGNTKLTALSINSEAINGDFTIESSGALATIDVSSIKTIEGDVNILSNNTFWDWMNPSGIQALPAFAALETINGDVSIQSNGYLTSLETFNSVTTFTGTKIDIGGNGNDGTGLEYVSVFNALTDGGPSQWTKMDINVIINTLWFDGFNALLEAKDININVSGLLDPMTWMTGTTKIDGFDAMIACQSLNLYIPNAESYTAFPALDNFKGFVNTYLQVTMPDDTNTGMCSMEPIFTKIKNGDFDVAWNPDRTAKFIKGWTEMDRDAAIDELLLPCTP